MPIKISAQGVMPLEDFRPRRDGPLKISAPGVMATWRFPRQAWCPMKMSAPGLMPHEDVHPRGNAPLKISTTGVIPLEDFAPCVMSPWRYPPQTWCFLKISAQGVTFPIKISAKGVMPYQKHNRQRSILYVHKGRRYVHKKIKSPAYCVHEGLNRRHYVHNTD